ncbi:MBL fold metallo-hydrolase [Cupriavidus agavae]|uniref:Glyoxylase-like metal-dependent hydrolase (Beta-lactamase superfamily II) n=1 Tax=Cupriavidus agavae TaxID=1001822 RepID=A0A4V2FI05_9BURK|nr:MBL fold metallo-hydrolase [Cupriavidus agavae]RZT42099.1 glyoxylase-like metal-dependent hydrolase (beta-lactamase superfamily II) [Cupriavidus agavae]
MSTAAPASPDRSKAMRHAASMLVLRDGPQGMEVLLMRRPQRADDRSAGAFVFPGGVLDPQDAALHPFCAGLDDAAASLCLGVPGHGLDYHLCAVREAFEEANLLFAYDSTGQIVRLDDLGDEVHRQLREAASYGGKGLAHVCEMLGLTLAVDKLAYCAYWLTPPGLAKRFDTRFFMAILPAGQTAIHDGVEAVEHRWMRPGEAADPASNLTLVNATRRILQSIAHFASAQECFDHARAQRNIALVMPRLAEGPRGQRPVMPEEPCYAEIARIDPDGAGHGRYALEPALPVRLSERVWRVTANNGNVMTGPGTNTYFVAGADNTWAVIDPGPDDPEHFAAVMAAAPGPVKLILTTHTHLDHSPGSVRLREATLAPVWGRVTAVADRQDPTFRPDHMPEHGDRIVLGPDSTLRVIHTPGHASNHLCFLLEEEKTLFTGDHVMQGSTVVINPPDGDMHAYLASLRALLDEDLDWIAPGHGFLMPRPHDAIRLLIRHRQQREAKVLNALRALAPADVAALLASVYDDVPERLHPVAQRSLMAHLRKLEKDAVATEADGIWALR